MHEHHVSTLLLFFVYGWLSKITCQFAPPPFGLDNFLFGGLGAFPPPPPPPPIGSPPIGIENFFGQGQFAPGMPPMGGSYPIGPLPFPLFPMPCDVMCDHAPLFFANIAITNPQQARPASAAGLPGGGAMPGGGGAGMLTTMRPGAGGAPGGVPGGAPGGVPGAGAGAAGARPGAGATGAGMPGAGGSGATPTRPPGGAGMPTTMPTRPPTPGAGGAGMSPQNPNVNVQIMSFYPNYPSWCTGWCRFFYRPRPMMPPPPPPPPPPPLPLPHPACLLFSWLGW